MCVSLNGKRTYNNLRIMISEKVMDRLLDNFEKVIEEAGVKCMRINDRSEFLRRIYENEMKYDGFVILKSSKQSGIFYVDTEDLLGSGGMNRVPRPLKKSDFDIPANVPPLNTKVADAIDMKFEV